MGDLLPCPFCGAEMLVVEDGIEHPASDTCPMDCLWLPTDHITAWNTRALPSATQVGGWMPPDGSVMVAIPIRLAKEFRDHVADEMAAWPDDTAYQDDLLAFASALDFAPLPPAPEASAQREEARKG